MENSIRIATLLIWTGWIVGSSLSILGAVMDIDAGMTGLLIALYATIAWGHRWFNTVQRRELVAFDQGRKYERALDQGVVPMDGRR